MKIQVCLGGKWQQATLLNIMSNGVIVTLDDIGSFYVKFSSCGLLW